MRAITLHALGLAQWGGSALAASATWRDLPSVTEGHMHSSYCWTAESQAGPATHTKQDASQIISQFACEKDVR